MERNTLDLRKIFGIVGRYSEDQQLVSPDKPFVLEWELHPGGQSGIHAHPLQDESYKVHQGEMQVLLNGKWNTLRTGEEIFIPKNAVHAFRNNSSEVAHITNIHSPGMRFGESMAVMENLLKEGKVTGMSGFRNIIYLSLHAKKYHDILRVVKPPQFLINIMATIGSALGYRI